MSTVEIAIVVGQLPGRAGVWLTAYADKLAHDSGTTALIRLGDHEDSVQLVGLPEDHAVSTSWPTFSKAIGGLAGLAKRWIIRSSSYPSPDQVIEAEPDRITILSSAHELVEATVCRLIRDLVETSGQLNCKSPAIGLVVAGADQKTAERMVQRINDFSRSWLNDRIELVTCLQRIEPLHRTTDRMSFADESVLSARSVIRLIRDLSASLRQPSTPRLFSEQPESLVKCVPSLTLVDIHCPHNESVEIATDTAGRFHLLARESQLRELHSVEAWFKGWINANPEKTEELCSPQQVNLSSKMVWHLFTNRPTSVEDLLATGSDLGLHMLAPIPYEGRRLWCYAPLNTAACVEQASGPKDS